jgi:DNA repair exonuclease SbcCD nuclease subunit
MRLLHTADLHIGANRSYPNYLERQRAAIEEIMTLAEDVDCLIVAGDLTDHAQPHHEERALISKLFHKCPCPIVAITGNHDRYGKRWQDTTLNWLVPLAARLGHRVWDTPTAEKFHNVWWLALPYNNYSQADLYLLIPWMLSQVPANWEGPVVLISHEFYAGAETDTGYSGKKDRPRLPLSKRISYAALGDIHKHQQLNSRTFYSGSPFQRTFGEVLPKGVLRVSLKGPRLKAPPEFIALTSPTPLVTLDHIPKKWPKAFVRLQMAFADLPSSLPANVVQIKPTDSAGMAYDTQTKEHDPTLDTLPDLDAFLRRKKLPVELVDRGIQYARKLMDCHEPSIDDSL